MNTDISKFVYGQQARVTATVADVAARAYSGNGSWDVERLRSAVEVVGASDGHVTIRDQAGNTLAASSRPVRASPGRQFSAPIIVGTMPVGSVTVTFSHQALVAAESQLEARRWHARLWAGGIAVVLALAVSIIVSRRITAPLERVLAAMRARGAGDRSARVADTRSVGVLGEVLEGFNEASDALDRRDRAQRNLIASVAHELRTPVAILQAGHESMLDGITEPTPENLASLRDEVMRLSRTLDDVRALANAEAAAVQLSLSPNDLADIAADAAGRLTAAFEMAGLRLSRDLGTVTTLCDRDRTCEVVTNLLTNSLKYTPAGGCVHLETGQDGDQARLRVRDSGIGIPPEELPHVTERFFRGRRPTDMATGTGLGLTIIAELVAAHHGGLNITSEPGDGTRVTVTLPMLTPSITDAST